MRIAISGSHATGKTTLVRELAERWTDVTVIDEPYYVLADEGYAFADPPTSDDFEALCERSLSLLKQRQTGRTLFDRSPADYLAYLTALRPENTMADRIREVAAALATLDLVVYVPIESPDRIDVSEAPRLRRRVDELLREMLVDRAWPFEVPALEVRGTSQERAAQVIQYVQSVQRGSP